MKRYLKVLVLFLSVALSLFVVFAQDTDPAIQAKIESAMSAAPAAIAKNATIVDNDMDANGEFIVLREGSNSWYCMPDLLSTPGNDPACNDKTFMEWTLALFKGEAPKVTNPGLSYMLQGGSDASNTDPLAMEPAPGDDWVTTPPHVMLVLPGKLDMTIYSTDPNSGEPYIMWAGTPYEHIMLPVTDMKN